MDQPTAQLFRITSGRLADWLEAQGPGLWWTVDGDWLLLGSITLPTTADRLAAKFRTIDKSILVLDSRNLHPGSVDPSTLDLNRVADSDNATGERVLCMRWDDDRYPQEWLLCEDKFSLEMSLKLESEDD